MKVKELIDQRVKLHEDAKAIWAKAEKEKRNLTAEEREQVRTLNGKVDELRKQIDELAAGAEEEKELRSVHEAEERVLSESRGRQTGGPTTAPAPGAVSARDANLAFRGWALGKQARPEMIEAAQRCGTRIDLPFFDMAVRTVWGADGRPVKSYVPVPTLGSGDIDVRRLEAEEQRAMSVGTTTAGGNFVPNEMMRRFTEIQKWYGRVADLAELVTTETGATLPWPTADDTGNTGEIKTEGTSANAADPTIGIVNLGAFTLSSKRVPVSWELLQDSFVDIATLLGSMLGRRIARFKNTKFTVGAGTTEPKGLITGATTVAAAATNGFTADEVISLIHAVDKAYRALPETGFMLHDTILAYIRKMKDGQGRYLWEPSLQAGQPDRLYGYPCEPNNDMDSAVTTGKKLVAFGNIRQAFVVRMAGATRFIRDESILVQQHQTYFEAWERGDSNVVDSGAVKVLTLA